MFLGEDLLPWLLLALGAAMVVGNVAALVRPPATPKAGELARAPKARSITMIVIGMACVVPALAALAVK